MGREPENFAYYSVKDENGLESVCHAVVGHQPKDAVLITKEQADTLNAAVDARSPKTSRKVSSSKGSVDLGPLLDKIDALSKEVLAQAQALDEANNKISGQANDIAKVRENTAKAIAQITEGIGEQKA